MERPRSASKRTWHRSVCRPRPDHAQPTADKAPIYGAHFRHSLTHTCDLNSIEDIVFFSVKATTVCEYLIPCTVDMEGTTLAVKPLPATAVITAIEHCERYLRSLQHEDLDSHVCCLWSPYVIGQTIIFSCCGLLWSPYGIGRPYIFSCCGLFFLSFFFLA